MLTIKHVPCVIIWPRRFLRSPFTNAMTEKNTDPHNLGLDQCHFSLSAIPNSTVSEPSVRVPPSLTDRSYGFFFFFFFFFYGCYTTYIDCFIYLSV